MKNRYLPLVGLGIALFAIACKKTDVGHDAASTETSTPAVSTSATASNWKTINNWQAVTGNNQSLTYQAKIDDPAITSLVATKGLVLVYANNGKKIESLPFEQKDESGNYSWYYQVSEGTISISAQSHGAQKGSITQGIKYFVLTPEQVSEMAAKGFSKSDLMQMDYEQAERMMGK